MRVTATVMGIVALAIFAAFTASGAKAQSTITQQGGTSTNAEPAKITLQQLYDAADTVAEVQIVASDGESYTNNVYKARVVTNFKGVGEDTIYFGPFPGLRLGVQYFLFLRKSPTSKDPVSAAAPGFGAVPYWQIPNEIYSVMESSNTCAFPGSDAASRCDEAVRICTDYVTLPKNMRAYTSEKGDPQFGCRWVHKKNSWL